MAGATLIELWRYPVKSMQGEQLDAAWIDERGVLGDRAYAVLDRATGHVASAKHPRKWAALFACRAAFAEAPLPGAPLPPLRITLPDGHAVRGDDPDCDAILSAALGRDVTLISTAPPAATREADRTPIDAGDPAPLIRTEPLAAAAPPGSFFDYAPLHILSTATLARLAALYPAGAWEARRFRPNLLVHTADGDETAWLGRNIAAGQQLRLNVIDPAPRCVVTSLPQDGMPRDPNILRTISRHSAAVSVSAAPGVLLQAVAGVYAVAVQPGFVYIGDPLRG